jgi:hypothetical protein
LEKEIKVTSHKMVLFSYDWCPYKKRKPGLRHTGGDVENTGRK